MVSKATAPGGGASRVAEDLAGLVRASGREVDHWVGFYSGAPRPGLRQLHGPRALRPLVRLVHRLADRAGLPGALPLELAVLAPRLAGYELLHFHDLPGAVSPLTLFTASLARPCVLTLHDCSFFTGGCIQPLDCPRFAQGCGDCPQRGVWPVSAGPDRTALLARMKRRILRRATASGRLSLAAPSRWMASMLETAGVRVPVQVIPNSVDCRLHAPVDRAQTRRDLGLPLDRPLVLVMSGSLADRFKGVPQAAEALRRLAGPRPLVLAVGIPGDSMRELFAGLDVRFTGYLAERGQLARHMAAADVLLYPSLADNLPLTVIEAMACGVPAVSFATGGIRELIDHDRNGWLAPCMDIDALAKGLHLAVHQGAATAWGRAARDKAAQRFSHERALADHLELYARAARQATAGSR